MKKLKKKTFKLDEYYYRKRRSERKREKKMFERRNEYVRNERQA